MNVSEWALVAFTILAQMSVGSFWVLGFVHVYAQRQAGEEEADRLSDRALLVIGVLLLLGLLASLLHLGDPLNSFRAVSNLGSSWLSREILFGVLFGVLGVLFAIMQWRKIGSFTVRTIVALLASLAGLGLITSMSMVYRLATQPSWDTPATPILFFTTTLLLGLLAMGATFVANFASLRGKEDEDLAVQTDLLRGSLHWIGIAAILLLGVELVVAPLYIANLASGNVAAQAAATLMVDEYGTIMTLRLILAFLSLAIIAAFLYLSAGEKTATKVLGYLVFAAFALVLLGEVLGRYLFYATQVSLGI
jgi:anaerobic dimethyl sulfoxide reductase subunit C (anchor subunit)